MKQPCDQCPWRLSNQGKPHRFGFYTMRNLRRLWGQVRRGGNAQSCHLTDPSHPDHVAVGAREGAKAQECPGSVILVLREIERMAEGGVVTVDGMKRYLAARRRGLTKSGVRYWVVMRIQFGGMPLIGEPKLPDVDVRDAAIGLPACLGEG